MKVNAKQGLFYAAAEMLHDSNTVEPKTPKKSGDLRGSWHLEAVENGPEDWELQCGFNIEYAAAVHEMLQGTAGGGAGEDPSGHSELDPLPERDNLAARRRLLHGCAADKGQERRRRPGALDGPPREDPRGRRGSPPGPGRQGGPGLEQGQGLRRRRRGRGGDLSAAARRGGLRPSSGGVRFRLVRHDGRRAGEPGAERQPESEGARRVFHELHFQDRRRAADALARRLT